MGSHRPRHESMIDDRRSGLVTPSIRARVRARSVADWRGARSGTPRGPSVDAFLQEPPPPWPLRVGDGRAAAVAHVGPDHLPLAPGPDVPAVHGPIERARDQPALHDVPDPR